MNLIKQCSYIVCYYFVKLSVNKESNLNVSSNKLLFNYN